MDADALIAWHGETRELLESVSREWPACWGGQFRVGPDAYVDETTMYEIVGGQRELNLWYCACACDEGKLEPSEVASHAGDGAWLEEMADIYIDRGGDSYYTECSPADFDLGELCELADEREDLFDAEAIYSTELVLPAMRACLIDRVSGERAGVELGGEGYFAWPRTERELRRHFAESPDLADQREAGTRFEDWVSDCERRGLLVATDGLPLRELTQRGLTRAWSSLGDVPTDDRDTILEPWRCYRAGVDRFEIWRDFDSAYEGGVYELMFPGKHVDLESDARGAEACTATGTHRLDSVEREAAR